MTREAQQVARSFRFEATVTGLVAQEAGNIHDTFMVACRQAGRTLRYLLQRINTEVFGDPDGLMENIVKVTRHLRSRQVASRHVEGDGAERNVVSVVPTVAGTWAWHDPESGVWRAYRLIEGCRSPLVVASAQQAFEAGRAFGRFEHLVSDLDPSELTITIPFFHDLGRRSTALDEAIDNDPVGRASSVRNEIELAGSYRELADAIYQQTKTLPHRVTHNDCKVSNVLFDERTGLSMCVVDLDTVMGGTVPWDFGDLVRSASCSVPEDEVILEKVELDLGLFEAVSRGYLSEACRFLTDGETAALASAGELVTFEQAIRFLTDYLEGDRYYRTSHPGHNLERARAQLKLLESMRGQTEAVVEILGRLCEYHREL